MLKRLFLLTGAILVILVLVILVNLLRFSSIQTTAPEADLIQIDQAAADRLAGAIRFPTISHQDSTDFDPTPFGQLHHYLDSVFPLIREQLTREVFGYSLLYSWKGKDEAAAPVVLMSHMDVVPVDESTLSDWEAPPFSGIIRDGTIYGQGAMDDKNSMMAIMEAVELSLADGYVPSRTIYLAFGHDEEIGGKQGAGAIALAFRQRGIEPEFVLDEGGQIAEAGMIAGIDRPIALINVAEKGYVSYELSLTTAGGHSSNPPADNTIGSMARAIARLEKHQFPYRMVEPVRQQIRHLGPEFDLLPRIAFANLWIAGKMVLKGLNSHTTTAPTIFHSGVKDNVIPTQATAVVNFRLLQGDTPEAVEAHIRKVTDDDRIQIRRIGNVNAPSAVSDTEAIGYRLVEKTVRQVIPGALTTPAICPGGTDTKHWEGIAGNAYRFFPLRINPENITGFHGINERITMENYEEIVRFYHQLLRNLEKGN